MFCPKSKLVSESSKLNARQETVVVKYKAGQLPVPGYNAQILRRDKNV
jgi:hypothetical protein